MSWLAGVHQRIRELLQPSRVAAELDAELRDHFARELEQQQHTTGSAAAARRQAHLHVGSADVAREAAADDRTGRVVRETVRDVRLAARGLRRNPGLAAAVVLSFALGIGGTTAIFSVVHAVLLRPLAYPGSDQLYEIRVWWKTFSATLSPADVLALREQGLVTGRVGAYYLPDGGFALETPAGPEVIEGGFVTPELPRVLGVTPILGASFSSQRGSREVLISESLWREHFGGRSDALGESLTLEGEAFTIVGVMPAGFNLPGRRNERVWVRAQPDAPTRRGPFFLKAIARLASDAPPTTAESALTSATIPVLRDRYGVVDTWRYGLRPLKDVLVGDTRETLLLMFAAGALVLLIAVANVANLLLARGTLRTREIAVRASLGASRGRLARQLLAESVLLGLIGSAAGLAVTFGVAHVARTEAATIVPRIDEVGVDRAVVLFALASGIAAGLAAGLLPVLRLPWTRLSEWLRAGSRAAAEDVRQGRMRQALVVAEVALALTVVTSAGLIVKSLLRLHEANLGFRPQGVLSFRLALPEQPYAAVDRAQAFMASLEDRLRGLPGVRSVGVAMSLPPDLLVMSNNYTVEAAAPNTAGPREVAEWNVVSPDYFTAMGIRVLRGRAFDTRDRAGSSGVAVVNEAFVRRHFAGGDALGRRLKGGDWNPQSPWITIVGVVTDVPYENGAWGGPNPMVYIAHSQNLWLQAPYIVIESSESPVALVPAVRATVASLDPRLPLRDVATMSDRVHRSTAVPRFRGLLFSALGLLALLLAVTGIYGVMAYHVSQRRRETAIRRALGARGDQIVRSTLGTGLRLAFAGIILGTAGAVVLTRSLSAILYQVDPRDPAILGAGAVVLATTAVIACAWPAVRAVQVDPSTLLREE
jgi:putative ABC transport system permease protein